MKYSTPYQKLAQKETGLRRHLALALHGVSLHRQSGKPTLAMRWIELILAVAADLGEVATNLVDIKSAVHRRIGAAMDRVLVKAMSLVSRIPGMSSAFKKRATSEFTEKQIQSNDNAKGIFATAWLAAKLIASIIGFIVTVIIWIETYFYVKRMIKSLIISFRTGKAISFFSLLEASMIADDEAKAIAAARVIDDLEQDPDLTAATLVDTAHGQKALEIQLKEYDLDGDGEVSNDEILQAISQEDSRNTTPKVRKMKFYTMNQLQRVVDEGEEAKVPVFTLEEGDARGVTSTVLKWLQTIFVKGPKAAFAAANKTKKLTGAKAFLAEKSFGLVAKLKGIIPATKKGLDVFKASHPKTYRGFLTTLKWFGVISGAAVTTVAIVSDDLLDEVEDAYEDGDHNTIMAGLLAMAKGDGQSDRTVSLKNVKNSLIAQFLNLPLARVQDVASKNGSLGAVSFTRADDEESDIDINLGAQGASSVQGSTSVLNSVVMQELAAKKAAGASTLSLADCAMHELNVSFETAMRIVTAIDVTNEANINAIQLLRRANRTPFLVTI